MKGQDFDSTAKKQDTRKDKEMKIGELTDSPSAAVRTSRKKAPRIGGTADVDDGSEPFAPTGHREQTFLAHQSSGGLQAPEKPVHGAHKKEIALAPPFPLEASVPVSAAPQDSGIPKKPGNAPSTSLVTPTLAVAAQGEESHEIQDSWAADSTEGEAASSGTAPDVSADRPPSSEEGSEQDFSVLDASVAPISPMGAAGERGDGGFMGEVLEEPPLASATIEGSWRLKLLLIGTLLLLFVGLVMGLIFGLNREDDILVTPSPSMQPSAAPTNTPLLGDWTQFGQDLVGEAVGDRFGSSIAMSADGNIVAIGAPYSDRNDTSTDSDRGSVYVFIRNGTSWDPLGGIIRGENAYDEFGTSVALSANGTMLAVGAPYNGDNRVYSGQVRIFRLVDNDWSQVGSNLNGENAGDEIGISVALSSDGTVLAVGAPTNAVNGEWSGQVRIFRFWNDNWSQVGSNLNGETENDRFGESVALSTDGTVLAVGAHLNDDNGINSGHVQIFQLVNNDWSQVGSSLNGENAGDRFGNSVALSADGTVLAVGAPYNDDNGSNSGQVRVFQLVNDDWSQVGSNLNGENAGDRFGGSVALSADGTILAVGAPWNEDNGSRSGHVRVFQFLNDDWIVQVGSAINGKGEEDRFGTLVALSADGKTVAGGATQGSEVGPGYVMVHRLEDEEG